MILMVMLMVSGLAVFAQPQPTKTSYRKVQQHLKAAHTSWYGKCSQENGKQHRFHKQFTKRVKEQIKSAKHRDMRSPRIKPARRFVKPV